MTKRKKGQFWPTDEHGIILNVGDEKDITPPWDAAVRDIIAACEQHIPNDIHSIYITGSVVRGAAVPKLSDINAFAVLEEAVDPELVMQDWVEKSAKAIARSYPEVNGVTIELWPYGSLLAAPEEFSINAFIIKTHSVCLWGANLAPELPDFTLSPAIANEDILLFYEDDFVEALDEIEIHPSKANTRFWCRIICKQIIHTAFALIMLDEGKFTRDLPLAAECFLRHQPQHKVDIEQALKWADRPSGDVFAVHDYLEHIADWLMPACEAWLDRYNPERCYPYGAEDCSDEEDGAFDEI